MKQKIFIISLIMLCHLFLNAQQRPHYTQNILNNFLTNPAIAGIENYVDVKLGARNQWVGIDGAPQTFFFTAHAPIGKKDYNTNATSFLMEGENPRGQQYWENYKAAQPHHGVGVSVISDYTGSYSWLTADIAYAYHLGVSAKTNLAAGFSVGYSKISLDRSKVKLPADVTYDPSIGNINVGKVFQAQVDLNAGLWLYSKDYFAGVAVLQLIPRDLTFTDNANATIKGKIVPHIFATAGYRFLLDDDFNLTPSVVGKYIQNSSQNSYQFELNLKLQYLDRLWAGLSYRSEDAIAGMLGMRVNKFLNVSYAYDYTTSPLNAASKGTHEIMLGFILNNKYDDTCPRANW